VEYGIDRGDLPADLDVEMAASMLDWMAGGFQGRAGEPLVNKDLDPGLLHRSRRKRGPFGSSSSWICHARSGRRRDPTGVLAQDVGSRRIADLASARVTCALR
jgi:hypothetical protein